MKPSIWQMRRESGVFCCSSNLVCFNVPARRFEAETEGGGNKKIYPNKQRWGQKVRGRREDLEGRKKRGGRVWLRAQRQENKPLKVIQLIHLDNTEASSYPRLPKLHTFTPS